MIRYSLACEKKHAFEVWFRNSADYDKQRKRGLLACPTCGSGKIEKTLMAPALGSGTKKKIATMRAEAAAEAVPAEAASLDNKAPVAMVSHQEREFRRKLKELRDHLKQNAEDVGGRFPEEARKMHYGEKERRSIYGEASPKEAKEMLDEGIEFHPLPVLPDEHN